MWRIHGNRVQRTRFLYMSALVINLSTCLYMSALVELGFSNSLLVNDQLLKKLQWHLYHFSVQIQTLPTHEAPLALIGEGVTFNTACFQNKEYICIYTIVCSNH